MTEFIDPWKELVRLYAVKTGQATCNCGSAFATRWEAKRWRCEGGCEVACSRTKNIIARKILEEQT